ncbi:MULTISPECIES: RNA polymerase sigma factor [unclassified Marinimicrobium]|jgi:RNA polymerase sigma-70 factor (ECF subfamily)|uniref:RNA polymerase sigma factor n=1 Tax=unclassified Marinimicrobium TaxID=2632100 RepID=UPI002580CC89|nr:MULTISPECIES: sigma-70 family RNA polymerase sigma factor [unclassified Marinimicrobium]|tara:strand:+ start:125 stop:688 length:564 start_codon:yes stop_codon:yes gene_type:complete
MALSEQDTDEQLLLAMAGGEMEAMSAFYRRHETRLYRFLMAKLNDSFVAADLLNEVMLEVWRSAARFAGRSKVTTWMFGIAHNKVLTHWRKLGVREFTEVDDTLADETPAADLEQALSAVKDAERVRSGMQTLSPPHREVLHLVFFEELDYAEIGRILSVPEGTVKSRVYHAKNLLKKQLARAMRSS